jgi:hypothetical protein
MEPLLRREEGSDSCWSLPLYWGWLERSLTSDKPLETHDQQFLFQLNTYSHSPYVTSSLTRGWICRLQLLLALASVVILRSASCGTHDHILLSQIRRVPPTWRARFPCLYPPGTGWPSYAPRHWVPVSSLPTIRRDTVKVSVPAFARGSSHRK